MRVDNYNNQFKDNVSLAHMNDAPLMGRTRQQPHVLTITTLTMYRIKVFIIMNTYNVFRLKNIRFYYHNNNFNTTLVFILVSPTPQVLGINFFFRGLQVPLNSNN